MRSRSMGSYCRVLNAKTFCRYYVIKASSLSHAMSQYYAVVYHMQPQQYLELRQRIIQ